MRTLPLHERELRQMEILQTDLNRRVEGLVPEPGSWLGPLYPNPPAPEASQSCPACQGNGACLHPTDEALIWQVSLRIVCPTCQGRGWRERD